MATRIRAEFRLLGSKLDHAAITSALGLKPTATWTAGDLIPKTRLRRDQDAWIFSMPTREELDVSNALAELLQTIAQVAKRVAKLREASPVQPMISCVVYVEDAAPSVYLTNAMLHAIDSLGAGLDIDLILSTAS